MIAWKYLLPNEGHGIGRECHFLRKVCQETGKMIRQGMTCLALPMDWVMCQRIATKLRPGLIGVDQQIIPLRKAVILVSAPVWRIDPCFYDQFVYLFPGVGNP